jgi:prephenate dehydratase
LPSQAVSYCHLLLKFRLYIVGEYDLRVEHSFLAHPGLNKSDIISSYDS